MVLMIPTIETISVVCLTEEQEDGDLILDLMVDGINMVSYTVAVLFGFFSSTIYEEYSNYENYYWIPKTSFSVSIDLKKCIKV